LCKTWAGPRLSRGKLRRVGDARAQDGRQTECRIDRLTALTERTQLLDQACLLFQCDGKLGSTLSDHLFKLLGRLFALDQQPIKRDRIVAKYFDSAAHLGDLVMPANRNRDVATSTYNGAHSSRKRGESRNNFPSEIEPDNKERTDKAEHGNRQQCDVAEPLDGLHLICRRRDTAFRIGD